MAPTARFDIKSETSSSSASDVDENEFKQAKHHRNHNGINALDRYQIELSLFFLTALKLSDLYVPSLRPVTHKFLHLQYRYPGTNKYDIGTDDIYFIITGMFLFTLVRAVTMNYFLRPVAGSLGIHKHKPVQRFMEQGWYAIYYTLSFFSGCYLLYHSNYYNNLDNLFIGWPNDMMAPLFKGYYLMELACWLQQIFVLNVEEKRKDHYQMLSHHIITCLLIGGSYYYYFTKIGHVILSMMDVVDIFLSTAKILKYSGFTTVCDWLFGFFVILWVIMRHGMYNYVLYHLFTKGRSLMIPGKCVEGILQKRCWTDQIITNFCYLLGGLQIITIIWMYLIIKVLIKVVTGSNAEDVRSDDEDDDDEEED